MATTEDIVPLRRSSSFIDIPVVNSLLCIGGEKIEEGFNQAPSFKGNAIHIDPDKIPIDARVLLVILQEVKEWDVDSCNL